MRWKPSGQNVQEETADERIGGEPHDLAPPLAAIILVGEGDMVGVDGDEPRVRDGGAMGVAGEIGEHLRGTAKRGLA